ncbi:hypothetical protein GIB67_019133 [Kingdonia uniflora]|uniref:Uncharacterized protein n=1 Tax=Kingdonia uniflora TaxID=39325 RepID=A0A7J7MZY5_9MAGN|nr:hypothetical protein GIB67_019133 [Kingdonia uniflora]
MNIVLLYTIAHFGGDIIRPKIGSIVSYVGGSTKLTSHSSYEDFVTLLEETSKIHRDDCKLYNFVHCCACTILSVQDFTVMIYMHKTNPSTPFHIWIVNELTGKGLSTTKDSGSGKGLSTTKAGGPLCLNSFPDPEPEYRGYPETNGRGLDPRRFGPLVDDDDDVPQSNDYFKTICTDVPSSNEYSIPQSNVHLSNKPALTNAHQSNELFQTVPTNVHLSNELCISQSNIHLSNEPVLTNIPLSNEPEPIIGQTEDFAELRFESQPEQVKDLMDFWFKSAAYTKDSYDFSKEFNIGDLYRDRIELKNHIRVYAVVNKFNLEHDLSNKYKIVMRCSFEHAYQLLMSYFAEVRYGVAYTNYVESWNNVILKERDPPIYVFIEELRRICLEMSYTYREEAEKSQARLTPWATDHCESKKFMVDSLTCRVCTSRHHFQITSYGRTDSVNIEDGTCPCRWWQTMGIPYEYGVRTPGFANVDPITRVSEYFTNDTYKAVYEPIWIPIRGIEQWKILKTDPRVHAPIPTVQADRPRTQRKRREKNVWSCHQTKILQ